MSESYEVHSCYLESIDFNLLVLEIPENEVEDKLTQLVREKGQIPKTLYEDFLIAMCIANLNQLLSHVAQEVMSKESFIKVREEVSQIIIDKNPLLDPTNIVVNRNHVLKMKRAEEKNDDIKSLVDNKNWNIPYYDEISDYYGGQDLPSDTTDDIIEETNEVSKDDDVFRKASKTIKEISSLEFGTEKRWWNRINQYVNIKIFKEEDARSILQRHFKTRLAFTSYITSICVDDFEALYQTLDDMGITNRVTPPILINELYELCKESNKFLTFENSRLFYKEIDDGTTENKDNRKTRTTSSKSKTTGSNSKSLKFKDVSKKDLLSLSDRMKVFLVGQDESIEKLAEAIQRASVGLKDPVKPIGSFLFAGCTGVGKTLATKVLADTLINNKDNLITIDCSEYSADHEYSKLIGCFVPGTKVLMEDASRKSIEDVNIGDKVITHKGRIRDVEFVHEYEQNGEMIEIMSVNSNVAETMTKTHEVLAIKHSNCDKGKKRAYRVCKPTCKQEYCVSPPYENYKMEWIPAYKLEKNDIVVYPRYKPTNIYPTKLDLVEYIGNSKNYKYDNEFIWAQRHVKVPRYIKVDENFTRLAGYYVSEGGTSGSAKTINFTFNSKERDYIIEIVKLIRKVFGTDIRIRVEDRTKDNSYRIWASSKIVCNFMSDLFGHNTYVKKVPGWFKDMPDNLLKGFLETAVFGDGCLTIPRRMDYSTVSETLHTQMELFFRRLGYITTTSLEKSKKDSNWKDRYRLYISGSQIEKLSSEFNFNIDLSDMKLTKIQRMAWIDDDYVYKQIKRINTVNYTGKVYDLAIEEDVSYVLDFIVHNSPAGYIGHENGGFLTNAVSKNPFSVVVFDEVEKASRKVHELLLQILEEGRLTDGQGKPVSFKDVVVIMTSNVGVEEVEDIKRTVGFGDVGKITEEKKNTALDEALKKKFKPEFLNRIDNIISFRTLQKADYMKIIDIELFKLSDNLQTNDTEYKNIILKFNKKIKNYIFKHGIDEDYGARPLKRCIEKDIATPLALRLLKEDIDKDGKVLATVNKGKIEFDIEPTVEEPPFYMEEEYKVMSSMNE